MQINDKGLALIKSFEGCSLSAYQDIVGVWTIGYGHTGNDVYHGLTIDQDAAEALLRDDLSKFEEGVGALLTREVTGNQFSALVSFSFNLGLNSLKQSTLLRCLNKFNDEGAASEFLKWNHAGGRIVAGLTRRREAERDLFLEP